MADPRLAVSYQDIDAEFATFPIDNSTITYDATKVGGSASVNLAVTLSADDTVALVADADAIIGKLISVEADNFARVQFEGYMTLPGGQSATLTRGTKIVGALGPSSAKGYIRSVNTAVAAELGKARGFIQNVADTTAVVVNL